MSKKNLASTRARILSACHYLAISLLMFGFVPGVWAQTWDTTISFNGSGGDLDMSSGGWAVTGVPDPILTVSMTGTGVNTATANGGGGYNIASFFNVFADVSIPNSYGPTGSSFSITQPTSRNGNPIIATDPGLTVTAPPSTAAGNSFSAFDGLFPPLSGSEYTGSVTNTAPHFFQYNSTDFYLTFKGPVSLTLGDTPTVVQSGDSYSYYYPDSELELTANIVFNDPVVDFTGTVEITTTVAAPDSSPGLAGVLALLAVCAGGAWQKAREA
jgi:hypothetical protein